MQPGIVLNASLTLAAGTFFLIAADRIRMRRWYARKPIGSVFAFYVVFGVLLVLAGLRLFISLAYLEDARWLVADKAMFYAVCICAALTVGPLMHLATQVITGKVQVARIVSMAFLAMAGLALYGLFDAGLAGPFVSPWNVDWEIQSMLTIAILVMAGLIPAIATAALLYWQSRRLDGPSRIRAQGVSASLLLYFLILALGAVGVHGAWVLLERIVYLAAGWIAFESERATADMWGAAHERTEITRAPPTR